MQELDYVALCNLTSFENIYFPIDDDITKEIDSYLKLPNGWDYGAGVAPQKSVCLKAKLVYVLGKSYGFFGEPHVEADGIITLILSIADHFLDVEISEDNNYLIRYEVGRGLDYVVKWKELKTTFNELETVLIQIKNACQPFSSEPLISNNTAPKSNDLKTKRFSENTEREFPFSIENVQYSSQEIFVSI